MHACMLACTKSSAEEITVNQNHQQRQQLRVWVENTMTFLILKMRKNNGSIFLENAMKIIDDDFAIIIVGWWWV